MMNKYKIQNIFAFTALAVLGATLLPGYTLSFDMPWGPNFAIGDMTDNAWLLRVVISALSHVGPGWLTQKVILFLIIFLAGLGAYKLFLVVTKNKQQYVSLLAGIVYIFNPFFYTRLISGQWLVLVGYALLPWAILSIYKLLQNPKWKTAWPVAAWTAAIGLTSIHTIGIVGLAALVMVIVYGKKDWLQKLKWGSIVAVMWMVINAIWLVPLLTGASQTSQNIASFDSSQLQAFATKATVGGSVPLSAALLTGFWADDQNRYILPSSLPIWWVGVGIIMSLVIIGLCVAIRRRNKLGTALAISGFIAWLLAMGIASPISAWLTQLLIHIVPFYSGYREPQKWLMLLALAYAFLATIGAQYVYARAKQLEWRQWAPISMGAILLAPFLFAPTLAWGAAGQLKSVDYPREWYATKSYLNEQDLYTGTKPTDTKILVMPWHMYLPVSWVGRVVANPSKYFFDQTMITSDNPELEGVKPQNRDDTVAYVSNELIPITRNHTGVAAQLKAHHIDYVLLLKEADWNRYGWLDGQTNMPIVKDNAKLKLYKVEG